MIIHDPTVAGPHAPVTPAPPRPPGSLRRTSTIDTNRPDGILGPPIIVGRARDLLTAPDGGSRVVDTAELRATLSGPDHRLVTIETEPRAPALQQLLDTVVGPGFRARIDKVLPELVDTGSPLYLLLDDLPGATLVSGYSMLHADAVPGPKDIHDEYLEARGDLCAGWARDGAMLTLIRKHGQSPTPIGPDAPDHRRADDPDAWHPVDPLGPFGMRRLRRLDVLPPHHGDDAFAVDVFFRDSHVDGEGRETIVHEYSVRARIDEPTRTIIAIEADADVLPWQECPDAVGSAARLAGHPLAGLRPYVRREFVGTTTCTHLNDVLRGLTDVNHLIDVLHQSA